MKTAALFLALATTAWAADPVPVPPAPTPAGMSITGAGTFPAYDLVRLKAAGAPSGAVYFWSITPKLKPSQSKRGKGCIDFTGPPGTYTINLRAVWPKTPAKAGDPVELDGAEVEAEVVIDAPPGPPTPPVPVTPPTPPAPTPSDPTPAAMAAVTVAYATDVAPDKATAKVALALVMRSAALGAGTAATYGDLSAKLKKEADTLVGPVATVLPATRRAIGAYVASVLPTDPTFPITDRKAAAAVMAAVASTLEGIK